MPRFFVFFFSCELLTAPELSYLIYAVDFILKSWGFYGQKFRILIVFGLRLPCDHVLVIFHMIVSLGLRVSYFARLFVFVALLGVRYLSPEYFFRSTPPDF